jgi:hypothetical protein
VVFPFNCVAQDNAEKRSRARLEAVWIGQRTHLGTVLVISLSSPEGGEGRGEEADDFSSSNPLTPTLSPLGRGGSKDGAKMHP